MMEAPRHRPALQAALLRDVLPQLEHAFLGVVEGAADGAAAAARVALGPHAGTPLELGQPHGPRIIRVDGGSIAEADRLAADGALAGGDFRGWIAIRSADCVPVLAADPETGYFAALHAGWRGTAAGILPELLRQLRALGSGLEFLRLVFGPGIGPCCFEVRADCIGSFQPQDLHHALRNRGDRNLLDLHRVLRNQALAAGVGAGQIETLPLCTVCARDGAGRPLLASFRRSNQQGDSNAPRNYSLIGIPAAAGPRYRVPGRQGTPTSRTPRTEHMERIYEGSVKNIYLDEDPQRAWFEYTDDYSVFDWGKMPDTLPGKGETLAKLAEWFFVALADPARWAALGLDELADVRPCLPIRHHFVQRRDNRILVQRVVVPELPATTIGGNLVYDYSYALAPRQLIPLEVIFRFGVPAGSSLLSRKDWYPLDIHEGAEFDEPLVEFSTKLESRDRVLGYQEAALVLRGRAGLLEELWRHTRAIALFLQRVCAQAGLKLWDGKLEWALCDGVLTLVDSIGPDELRVSGPGGAVFSKQFLRDFYLGTPWEQAVQEGKALARQRGTAEWKAIVRDELHQAPEPLSQPYREAARLLYQDFYEILAAGGDGSRFARALAQL